MRTINHLYIIGNGFDLYHGLPTGYGHFREYVKKHDSELDELVEKYYMPKRNGDFWSDFEDNLGNFDDDLLREYGQKYLEDYGCENWKDAFHHDYQFELNTVINKITQGLHNSFVDWLSQISFNGVKQQAITLDKDAYYLTFNYTRTLEKVYNIPRQNILHIHGTYMGNDNDEIIYGHGGRLYTIDKDIEDPRIEEGERIIRDYFDTTAKPVKQIIHKYRKFFYKMVIDATNVTIIGHSMNDIDYPYFWRLFNSIKNSVNWTYYYHSIQDIEKCIKRIDYRLRYKRDRIHILPYPD